MSSFKTPVLGAKGIFTLLAPFSAPANTTFTVEAVRSYNELINDGVDIFNTYYATTTPPISQDKYNEDLAAGATLVTLMATGQTTIFVPDAYIDGYPVAGGIPYDTVILAMSLGPLPPNLDLSSLVQQIQDAASSVIGVTADVKIFVNPGTSVLTPDQAATAETTRQAAITNRTSDYAELLRYKAMYQDAQQQLTALQDILISQQPAPSPAPSP